MGRGWTELAGQGAKALSSTSPFASLGLCALPLEIRAGSPLELQMAQSHGESLSGGGPSPFFSPSKSYSEQVTRLCTHSGCAQCHMLPLRLVCALQSCLHLDTRHSVSVVSLRIKSGSQLG